jgi:hypothetical protein
MIWFNRILRTWFTGYNINLIQWTTITPDYNHKNHIFLISQ